MLIKEKRDLNTLVKLALNHAEHQKARKSDTAAKVESFREFVAISTDEFMNYTISNLSDLENNILKEANSLFGNKKEKTNIYEQYSQRLREDSQKMIQEFE